MQFPRYTPSVLRKRGDTPGEFHGCLIEHSQASFSIRCVDCRRKGIEKFAQTALAIP